MAFGKKKAAATEVEEQKVYVSRTGYASIAGVKQHELNVLLIGTAILVVNNFSEKSKLQMADSQQGNAKGARAKKVPHELFEGARYRLADGTDGIPAGGLKACFVAGARGEVSVAMSSSKGAITVLPDGEDSDNLVRILHPEGFPIMREDMVRNANGVADLRYRPEFSRWALDVTVKYIPALVSQGQLLQMIAHAGIAEGLCEWRPGSPKSKSGQWGTFRLATEEELHAFEDGRLFQSFEGGARRKPSPHLKRAA